MTHFLQGTAVMALTFAIWMHATTTYAAPSQTPSTPAQTECHDAQTQTAMNQCAAEALQNAEHRLTTTYQSLKDALGSAAERAALETAQRRWTAYRDAECQFQGAPSAGGSIHTLVVAQCKTALSDARQQTLKGYSQCEEGDVSCPHPRLETP
ncbi:lysozyme inhibitor LprI family protein [Larsenimonas suaedae]|uniref:Lysozyme inhibitor LprI family protein n=1 Tax=Larsenimonas suaedae TaxID=1851019 RepID=A0ABU1GSL5_9GAMM|nr:lysozyme inhibitor LprI family protein [Larsenimonas suaedae]MCM2972194.1 lysozyme inhibitor LprI family protein [Larsenimonas suaedae]MDR5895010.1 lysozyme inhibitor LprI family protein [Larsenimonas suaedae]